MRLFIPRTVSSIGVRGSGRWQNTYATSCQSQLQRCTSAGPRVGYVTYEIHIVELQALQRRDHAFVQVLARQSDAVDCVALCAAAAVELGRDD